MNDCKRTVPTVNSDNYFDILHAPLSFDNVKWQSLVNAEDHLAFAEQQNAFNFKMIADYIRYVRKDLVEARAVASVERMRADAYKAECQELRRELIKYSTECAT
jgi:hypothetical protein